jgi:hypothetical protein
MGIMRLWSDVIWFRIGIVLHFYEHGYEPSICIKRRTFLDHLGSYWLTYGPTFQLPKKRTEARRVGILSQKYFVWAVRFHFVWVHTALAMLRAPRGLLFGSDKRQWKTSRWENTFYPPGF